MSATSEPMVQVQLDKRVGRGTVARVTIDRAAKLNVLNTPLLERLIAALRGLSDEPDLRLIILTGAGGRSFIGGADLTELTQLTRETAAAFITRVHQVCAAITEAPVPVIARIVGYCLGAGLEVAAACDLRVATPESRFGMPEVNVGVPSVVEAALLPRLIGWGKTSELVLTGRTIDAAEALECRFLERVAERDQLDAAVEEWTEAILNAGPRAIALQKELMRHWARLPVDQAIQKGIEIFAEAYETDEPQMYMKSFFERKR